jgi:O-antigen/teichoic acid export membrane protein
VLATNIISTFTAQIVLSVLALISSVVVARALGPEDRGLLALVVLLPEVATMIGFLGFEEANAVYAGVEPDRRRALLWHSVAVAGAVGTLISLAGVSFLVLTPSWRPPADRAPFWLFLLPISTIPAVLVTRYWQAIVRGMNRILMLNAVMMGTKVVGFILVVACVGVLRLGIQGVVGVNFLLDIAGLAVMGFMLRQVKIWGDPQFDKPLFRRTLRLAVPAHASNMAGYLNARMDALIIAAFLPPVDLGFYVIALSLVDRMWILPGAVSSVLLPHLTNSRSRDPALTAVLARHVMVWTAAASVAIFVSADMLVRILYSPRFSPTVAPLRWLLLGVVPLSGAKVLLAELLALQKPRYNLWASSAAAVFSVLANLLLVPRMGITGAALSSSLTYSLLSALLIGYYLKQTHLSWTALVPRGSDLQTYIRLYRSVPGFLARLRFTRTSPATPARCAPGL